MTTQKLDFEIHDIDIGVASLHKYCYWLQDKLKKLCQAVDAINERLDDTNKALDNYREYRTGIEDLGTDVMYIQQRLDKIESQNAPKIPDEVYRMIEEFYKPKQCAHDFDTSLILTSNPPKIKCKLCGFTKVFGTTPDVFKCEPAAEVHHKDCYIFQGGICICYPTKNKCDHAWLPVWLDMNDPRRDKTKSQKQCQKCGAIE